MHINSKCVIYSYIYIYIYIHVNKNYMLLLTKITKISQQFPHPVASWMNY